MLLKKTVIALLQNQELTHSQPEPHSQTSQLDHLAQLARQSTLSQPGCFSSHSAPARDLTHPASQSHVPQLVCEILLPSRATQACLAQQSLFSLNS